MNAQYCLAAVKMMLKDSLETMVAVGHPELAGTFGYKLVVEHSVYAFAKIEHTVEVINPPL